MAVRGLDTQLEPLDDWGVCDERLYKESGPYRAHVFATFGIRADCGRVAYLANMAVIGAIFESDCGWNFVYSANLNGAQVGHLQRYARENDFSPFLAYMRIKEQEGPGITRILNGVETRGFELSKANINHNHVRVLQLYHEPFLVKEEDGSCLTAEPTTNPAFSVKWTTDVLDQDEYVHKGSWLKVTVARVYATAAVVVPILAAALNWGSRQTMFERVMDMLTLLFFSNIATVVIVRDVDLLQDKFREYVLGREVVKTEDRMIKVLGITEGELKASLAAVSGRVGFVDGSNACYLNDAGPGMGIRFVKGIRLRDYRRVALVGKDLAFNWITETWYRVTAEGDHLRHLTAIPTSGAFQMTDIETEGSLEYSAADRAGGLQLIGGT
jgi:hypothetical protein